MARLADRASCKRHLMDISSRLVAILAVALASAACSSDATPTPTGETYGSIIGASELLVGSNRIPFLLVSRDGELLEDAQVTARFYAVDGDTDRLVAEAASVWRTIQGTTPHEHPGGETHLHLDFRGVYVVDGVTFREPGIHLAKFDATASDGTPVATEGTAFQVAASGSAPAVGQQVPATRNLTVHDVESFAELSTRAVERDELHNISVADALEAGEPFVVFFASPQFCVSAMCGPVTDEMERAHDELGGSVAFIHIEPWDLDAARLEGQLVPAPVMLEWGLPSEPWTFVVGAGGAVHRRFEGLVTKDEVLDALAELR